MSHAGGIWAKVGGSICFWNGSLTINCEHKNYMQNSIKTQGETCCLITEQTLWKMIDLRWVKNKQLAIIIRNYNTDYHNYYAALP